MQLILIIACVLFGIVIEGRNRSGNSLCDKKYQQHYTAFNCTPVYDKDPDCPSFYKCPEIEKNDTGCLYKGRFYHYNEDIDIGSECTSCTCLGELGDYEIYCLNRICPSEYDIEYGLDEINCYQTYKAGKCCSTGHTCLTDEENEKNICEYNGEKYHYGQRIYPKEDHCQTCICNKDWSGANENSCSAVDCNIDVHQKKFQDGCVPVYHDDYCCPYTYYCENEKNIYQNKTEPLATQEEIQSGRSCEFEGEHYKIGQALTLHISRSCANCTCQIPPIFTCIYKESCI